MEKIEAIITKFINKYTMISSYQTSTMSAALGMFADGANWKRVIIDGKRTYVRIATDCSYKERLLGGLTIDQIVVHSVHSTAPELEAVIPTESKSVICGTVFWPPHTVTRTARSRRGSTSTTRTPSTRSRRRRSRGTLRSLGRQR